MKHPEHKEMEAILSECLDRMAKGATVEDCLGAHPEHAAELRPLLLTSASLRGSLLVTPSVQARAQGRQRLQEQIATALKRPRRHGFLGVRNPWRVWASAGAMAVVLFGSGAGVVAASGGSLPDGPLYPVKRTVENVRLAWPLQSPESKAEFNTELAARRSHELVVMAGRNKLDQLPGLAEGIHVNLDRATRITVVEADEIDLPPRPRPQAKPFPEQRLRIVRHRLEEDYARGLAELNAVAMNAPPEFQPRIKQALARYNAHYQDAVRRIDDRLDRVAKPAPDRAPNLNAPRRAPRLQPPRRGTSVPPDGALPSQEGPPALY